MQSEYKDQLPASLQDLVDEIETAAGVEISVKRAPDLPVNMLADLGWGDMGGPVTLRLTLWYKSDLRATDGCYPVPFAMCCHELLHFKRSVVEHVPCVFSIRDVPQSHPDPAARVTTVLGIETLLEHLVIEPQVRKYGFDYPLNFCCGAYWEHVPPRPWATPEFKVHWQLMNEYLQTVFLCENITVKRCASQVMQGLGWLDQARAAADLMAQALRFAGDPTMAVEAKAATALVACIAFQIPVGAMGLLYQYRNLKMLSEILETGMLDRLKLKMLPPTTPA
jgi:hypothetical protein